MYGEMQNCTAYLHTVATASHTDINKDINKITYKSETGLWLCEYDKEKKAIVVKTFVSNNLLKENQSWIETYRTNVISDAVKSHNERAKKKKHVVDV